MIFLGIAAIPAFAQSRAFNASDLYKLRSAGNAALSPDGARLAYTVGRNDGSGRPFSQLHVMTLAGGGDVSFSREKDSSGSPEWSPDGQWIAYTGKLGRQIRFDRGPSRWLGCKVLVGARMDQQPAADHRKALRLVARFQASGLRQCRAWPRNGADATGDPIVITRYLYKPDCDEGLTHFNDNRRLHIFVADVSSGQIRQLTDGTHYEHSIDWSPDGREIAFVSNREPNEDQFFNYDLFTLNVATGAMRRLTATENAEYQPRWSPDGKTIVYLGTKRGLTDLETTMEDTHVWLIDADGRNRRELGAAIDNRQYDATWSPDGKWVYFLSQRRGSNAILARIPASGGTARNHRDGSGSVGSYSVSKDDNIAYTYASPNDLAEVFYGKPNEPSKS